MSFHKAWLINLAVVALLFFFLPWHIWNPIATASWIIWLFIVAIRWRKGNWELALPVYWKWALALPLMVIGLLLLVKGAPSALWLFCAGHAIAILLSLGRQG